VATILTTFLRINQTLLFWTAYSASWSSWSVHCTKLVGLYGYALIAPAVVSAVPYSQ